MLISGKQCVLIWHVLSGEDNDVLRRILDFNVESKRSNEVHKRTCLRQVDEEPVTL